MKNKKGGKAQKFIAQVKMQAGARYGTSTVRGVPLARFSLVFPGPIYQQPHSQFLSSLPPFPHHTEPRRRKTRYGISLFTVGSRRPF
jgi:hypothetical protein